MRSWVIAMLVASVACSGAVRRAQPSPANNAWLVGGTPRYDAELEAALREMPSDVGELARWRGLRGTVLAKAIAEAVEGVRMWSSGALDAKRDAAARATAFEAIEQKLLAPNRALRDHGLAYFIAIVLGGTPTLHAYRVERVTIAASGGLRLPIVEVAPLNGERADVVQQEGSMMMGTAVLHRARLKKAAVRGLGWLAAPPKRLPAALVERVQAAMRDALGDDAGRAAAIAAELVEWRQLRGASYLDPAAPGAAEIPRLAQLETSLARAGARDVIARFERAIVRTARLHEVQHVLDVRASRALPRTLLDVLGPDNFELAASEVSAYCATMFRDPDTLWFTIAAALLAADGPSSPTGRAVAVIVDDLARRIDPSRRGFVLSGVIDVEGLVDAGAFLATRDTADVARAAAAAWEGWFVAPLDDIRLP